MRENHIRGDEERSDVSNICIGRGLIGIKEETPFPRAMTGKESENP